MTRMFRQNLPYALSGLMCVACILNVAEAEMTVQPIDEFQGSFTSVDFEYGGTPVSTGDIEASLNSNGVNEFGLDSVAGEASIDVLLDLHFPLLDVLGLSDPQIHIVENGTASFDGSYITAELYGGGTIQDAPFTGVEFQNKNEYYGEGEVDQQGNWKFKFGFGITFALVEPEFGEVLFPPDLGGEVEQLYGGGFMTVGIPEPAALSIVMLGTIVLAGRRRHLR